MNFFSFIIEKHQLGSIERGRLLDEFINSTISSSYIITLCGFFVGAVLSIQGIYMLEKFSAQNQIGQVVLLSILRELGPVTSGLLFVGNVCSATTSEIAIGRLSQQNQALTCMGIDIYKYLYFPKLFAGTVSLPLLFLIFCACGTVGAFLVATMFSGVDSGHFWSSIHQHVTGLDLISGLIKSFVFSLSINSLAIFFGKRATLSSTGISSATTQSVVVGSVVIFLLDTILTLIFLGGLWQ